MTAASMIRGRTHTYVICAAYTCSRQPAYDLLMTDVGLERFNALPVVMAAPLARACCASSDWLDTMLAARPYTDRAAMLAQSRRALADLDWAGVREALEAHPRIGERAAGTGREATWSRREQSGMDESADDVRLALVEANKSYEERFGHVFLIFATGRSDVEMLAAARARRDNDEATERVVVRGELSEIVDRRLTALLDSVATDSQATDSQATESQATESQATDSGAT